MRSKVSVFLASSTLLLFAACSSAATSVPTPAATSVPSPAATSVLTPTTAPPTATPTTPTKTSAATVTPTVTAAGCPSHVGVPPENQIVTGSSAALPFAFDPADLTIPVGTAVLFWNRGFDDHTATADDGTFDCRLDGHGTEGVFIFTTAGTFPYHCAIHPTMKGTITVTP